MKETDLHFFIDSVLNYFEEVTNIPAETGIPFIKEQEPVVLDYTGIIGISGKRKGSVYITAQQQMLQALGQIILNVNDISTDDIKDLIGEIANIIAGNVRKAYGSDFMISVPVVIEGRAKDIKLPDHVQSFVIPIKWKDYQSYLVVCLE